MGEVGVLCPKLPPRGALAETSLNEFTFLCCILKLGSAHLGCGLSVMQVQRWVQALQARLSVNSLPAAGAQVQFLSLLHHLQLCPLLEQFSQDFGN